LAFAHFFVPFELTGIIFSGQIKAVMSWSS